VVTHNITTNKNDDFVDDEFARWVAHVNRPMANFNLHFGQKSKLAMCCRYENDLSEMGVTPDSFGNGGVNIGSHRVITPNYARAARLANRNVEKFYAILDDYFDVASKLLIVHRYDILQRRIDKNPDYLRFFGRLGWFNLRTMFSTFGVVGIHEAVEFMGLDILDDDGTAFGMDLMGYISGKVKQYRTEYGVAFNAEEIPGEQACVSLLQKDKISVDPHIPYALYSNQYIPLTLPADIVTRLDISGRFMKKISGGGIVHGNTEAQVDTDGKMYELMKLAAKSGVPHLAVCYRFGKCAEHRASIVGQGKECPICNKPLVQTRARVIGYFSDEYNWHPVRREYDAPNRYYSNGKELNFDE
jgi:ribonucleoside-triphosphate reductase